jgi:histone H4
MNYPPEGKRHKVTRHDVDFITAPGLKRICRRGGIKRLSKKCYGDLRDTLKVFLEDILHQAVIYTSHRKAKTVELRDVLESLRINGMTLYGGQGTAAATHSPRKRRSASASDGELADPAEAL